MVVIMLGACLAAGVAIGVADRLTSPSAAGPDLVIDAPGTFPEPPGVGGGIPTAPDLAGIALPELAITDLDGAPVPSASLIGQPLVVNLWYSTCAGCAEELPAFAEVHRRLGDRVRFVGLDVQDSAARAEEFAASAGVGYEILLGRIGEVARKLDILLYPATLFVEPGGRIVELHQGALTADALNALITEKLGVS